MDMYKVMVLSFLKKNWGMKFLMLLMILVIWFSQIQYELKIGMTFFALIYYGYIIIYYWIYTGSKSNKSFYISRTMTLTDESIIVDASDGSTGSTKWGNVVKVSEYNNVFLIYISKTIFYYLPKSAFKSETDLKEFEGFLSRGQGWG